MYSAIRDQLVSQTAATVDDLRRKTSEYIRENKVDFLPFMTSKRTGDMMTNGIQFFKYLSFLPPEIF